MIIEYLSIEDFKQFSKKLVIENLKPGLNVFTGNNEAGKSTIAEAVRTLFLERYKSSSGKEDMQPWSKPGAGPILEARFGHNGTAYSLSKQFLTRPRCNLVKGTQTLEGDSAEEHLAELFGFTRAQKGGMRPEQAGVPGLLWVQQGDAYRVGERAAPAAEYLRGALGQLSGGEIVGGEDLLIKTVEKQLASLRTKSKRDATGELERVQRQLQELQAQRTTWQQQLEALELDLSALTALQAVYDKDQKTRPWAELEAKAELARAKLAAVATAQQKLEAMRQDLKLSSVTLSNLIDKAKVADSLQTNLQTAKGKLGASQVSALDTEAEYTRCLAAAGTAQAAHDHAREAESLANSAATALELREQVQFLEREVLRLSTSVENAEKAAASLEEARATQTKLELDAKKLKTLQSTTSKLIPLRAQFEAASTRMEYRLNGSIHLDDELLSGTGNVLLESPRTLRLADLSELTILPGASDRQALMEQVAKLENERTKLLQTMGVVSLQAAEVQFEQWKISKAEVDVHQSILTLHAPDGLDALRTSLLESKNHEAAARARLELLPDTKDALSLADAIANRKKAALHLQAANTALSEATEKRSIFRTTVQGLSDTVKDLEAQTTDPMFVQARYNDGAALVEERTRNQILMNRLGPAETEFEALTLVDPQGEVERFAQSAQLARDKHAEQERKIIDLRARIQTAGGSGVGENLVRSAAELELLEAREQELVRRAEALGLLLDLLVEERNTAVQQLQSPLVKRLDHYLKWLFPQSALTLTDNLTPFTLGRAERFDNLSSLSFGTQEQLGILTRLAYADLLKEAGRPTVLFFDDAAVHTDALRRDAIKQALLDASKRHQIFLFTCHPENWNDLGVQQRSLEEMKAA